MTDLQFKSWLKQIIRGLEGAKGESTKEDTDKKIEELLKDLKEDLQGQRKGIYGRLKKIYRHRRSLIYRFLPFESIAGKRKPGSGNR